MSISHIVDLESGVSVLGTINDTIDQVNTNVTDIATNTSDISNLSSTKQDKNAADTTVMQIDTTQTGNYIATLSDNNKFFVIANAGATTFTIPAALALLAGAKMTISNHETSSGDVTITAGGGVTIRPVALLGVPAGSTYSIVKLASNSFRVFIG